MDNNYMNDNLNNVVTENGNQDNINATQTTINNNVKGTNYFAIIGFIMSLFFALPGLILSIIGLNKSKYTNSGKGLSIAGIIISGISLLITLIAFLLVLSTPSVIEKTICPKAYDCILDTDGKYNCKYNNSDGIVTDVKCSSKYNQ